jgi:hypothetical protein
MRRGFSILLIISILMSVLACAHNLIEVNNLTSNQDSISIAKFSQADCQSQSPEESNVDHKNHCCLGHSFFLLPSALVLGFKYPLDNFFQIAPKVILSNFTDSLFRPPII